MTVRSDTAQIEVMNLHPNEMQLLKMLRNSFGYGEVTVKMRDSLPVQIIRVKEYSNLDGK